MFLNFPQDWDTDTKYAGGVRDPKHTAYRGDHRLNHQPQQVKRDLSGEDLLRLADRGESLHFTALGKMRARAHAAAVHGMGYRYFLTSFGATSWAAFHTLKEVKAWARAYSVTFTGFRKCGRAGFTARAIPCDDMSKWEGLHVRDYRTQEA